MTRTRSAFFAIALGGAAVLAGYAILRSVSNSLFLEAYGAARLPYVMVAVPFGIALATLVYSVLLQRLGPAWTFFATTLLSCGAMAAAAAGTLMKVPLAPAALYFLKEIYIMLLVGQIWSFVNSLVTQEEARRFNGPLTGIGTLGAILGGWVTGRLVGSVGSASLPFVAAGFTLAAALFGALAFSLAGEPKPREEKRPEGISGHFALSLFRSDRRVASLAAIVASTQALAMLLDVAFHTSAERAFSNVDARSSYLARFWQYVDGASLVLQFIVAPFLLTRIRVLTMHRFFPLIHGAACVVLAVFPGLAAASFAFFAFKAIDYSLFVAAKEILYVPLSFEARYRAKAVIDTFVYRTTKGGVSGVLALLSQLVGPVGVRGLAFGAVAVTVVWSSSVRFLGRAHALPTEEFMKNRP